MAEKLILPNEIKVCATCTFWDGERVIDEEVKVVVVAEDCQGECLVTETVKASLHHISSETACLWEDLTPDVPAVKNTPD